MPAIRIATRADLPALHALIERAYRGDAARAGWTHEADLLDTARTDAPSLAAILADPAERILVAEAAARIVACVQVSARADRTGYLGMLAVDPPAQAGGIGRRMIAAAEQAARGFGATRMALAVLPQRTELIAYYERRGYTATGETRPFPVPLDPPFVLVVLAKALTA